MLKNIKNLFKKLFAKPCCTCEKASDVTITDEEERSLSFCRPCFKHAFLLHPEFVATIEQYLPQE